MGRRRHRKPTIQASERPLSAGPQLQGYSLKSVVEAKPDLSKAVQAVTSVRASVSVAEDTGLLVSSSRKIDELKAKADEAKRRYDLTTVSDPLCPVRPPGVPSSSRRRMRRRTPRGSMVRISNHETNAMNGNRHIVARLLGEVRSCRATDLALQPCCRTCFKTSGVKKPHWPQSVQRFMNTLQTMTRIGGLAEPATRMSASHEMYLDDRNL
ncbi:uncharacterized protein B0H18DRAFT_597850 [Fomitopsis serialis]|uniref:uncharacterized protein n=1 Tax=Fomitopsis serialis TaxID=139415 RepID=UPI0020082FD9|nr:uncharacterized protein B0H18DRAFT_597850 [Neoantrodia serialis]KAH9920389.1 hypothetical protein B0H18DRAFT_597850 [Neoantrodia serialis]